MNLLLALLLASSVAAQQGSILLDRFCGLNNTDTAATIHPCEGQDMINVEANLNATAIKKRGGYNRTASLTIATGPVNGSFKMTCDNGDELRIVCHDRTCSESVNNTAFTNFLSTAAGTGTIPTRWSFVSIDGDLYGLNDSQDNLLKYDCSTLSYPVAGVAGTLLALSADRMIVADTSANPNRIHYSKSGDFTDFTTGANSVDPYTDDIGAPGERTTALVYDRGKLWIFKRTSITACLLGDQYTSECFPISNNIGTQDPLSIVSAPDGIYFRAQDRSYWRATGNGVELLSHKIAKYIKNQAAGATRSNTQTTQADWEDGTLTVSGILSSVNTTIFPGSVTPSTWTDVDTSSADFTLGTLVLLDQNITHGDLVLSSTTYEDDFADGDFTSNPAWTQTGDAAGFTTIGAKTYFRPNQPETGEVTTTLTSDDLVDITSGAWTFTINGIFVDGNCAGTSNSCVRFRFINNAGGDFYAIEYHSRSSSNFWRLLKSVSGSETLLSSSATPSTLATGTDHSFRVERSTLGVMVASINGADFLRATDVSISSSVEVSFFLRGQVALVSRITDIFVFRYDTGGTILSRIFDTSFSSPTMGEFDVNMTTSSDAAATFKVQASTADDGGGFETLVAQTPSEIIAVTAVRRFLRYEGTFATDVASKTPTLHSVALEAATTGQYLSQCIQPGSDISAWGTISCASQINGVSTLTIAVSTGTSCSDLDTSGNVFTDETNNTTISVAVAAAMNFRLAFDMPGSSTDTIQTDACTVNWKQGSVAQPISGIYESINNSIYWTGQTTAAANSDRLLKFDLNSGYFYPFSLSAVNLLVDNNSIQFGSSDGGFWNEFAPAGVNSDNGSDINAFWKSKDFGGANPFQDTDWKAVSVVATNAGIGSITVSHNLSNGTGGSHTVSLATDSTKGYVRDTYFIPKASPQNFLNINMGNNSTTPFEIMGLRIDFHTVPWRPNTP